MDIPPHGACARTLPFSLTTLRLLLGPLLIVGARAGSPPWVFVGGLFIGLLSDIFDGILARRFHVATLTLRRYDGATDVVFYVCVLCCAWIMHPAILRQHAAAIAFLLLMELLCNAVSFARFRRPPATHCYLAKLWGLLLFATFVALLGFGVAGILFTITFIVGVIADLEVLALLLMSSKSPTDVPSFFMGSEFASQIAS